MEKLAEAFESLSPDLAAKVAELSPTAMVDLMTTMTDPIRAQSLLNADASGGNGQAQQGGADLLAQIQALVARGAQAPQVAEQVAELAVTPVVPTPDKVPVVAVPAQAATDAAPTAVATPDQMELLARCNALLATVTKAAEVKEKEYNRVWTTKAYQAQYQFNSAIKVLINAKEYSKAVAKLEARNADLSLSDSNPSLLATLDKAKQYSEGSGESLSNALIAALISNRSIGPSSLGTTSARVTSKRPAPSSGEPSSAAKGYKCYKCNRNGHIASSCHLK